MMYFELVIFLIALFLILFSTLNDFLILNRKLLILEIGWRLGKEARHHALEWPVRKVSLLENLFFSVGFVIYMVFWKLDKGWIAMLIMLLIAMGLPLSRHFTLDRIRKTW